MTTKCNKCFSKCNTLKEFKTKLLDGKDMNLCDICFIQLGEKEVKEINEMTSRGLDLSLYVKATPCVPSAIPLIEPLIEAPIPTPTFVYNTINNITNNNNVTNNNIHNHYKLDKEDKLNKNYENMVKEEEYRIKKNREQKSKKLWYSNCAKCQSNKHYEEYDLLLDKNEEAKVMKKLYGIENPKDEEGNPMYYRKKTCVDCLKVLKEKRDIDKPFLDELKKNNDNVYNCNCGGSYFLCNKFNKTRHDATKRHQEYIEKQHININKDVAVSVDYNKLKLDSLYNICKLNSITGYKHMKKEDILNAIKHKEAELKLEKKHIIMN